LHLSRIVAAQLNPAVYIRINPVLNVRWVPSPGSRTNIRTLVELASVTCLRGVRQVGSTKAYHSIRAWNLLVDVVAGVGLGVRIDLVELDCVRRITLRRINL